MDREPDTWDTGFGSAMSFKSQVEQGFSSFFALKKNHQIWQKFGKK